MKTKRFRDTPAFGNTIAALAFVVIAGVLTVMIPKADAETVLLPATEVVAEDTIDCMSIYYGAEMIMKYRQSGTPLPVLLDQFKDLDALHPTIKEAYTRSEFSTEEYQNTAIKEFAEKHYNECEAEKKTYQN